MSSDFVAVVAGIGPGTGAAIARKFAQAYPVILLARKAENYKSVANQINDNGGRALGISTDVSSQASLDSAVEQIKQHFGTDVRIAAAIFNASGSFMRKPFLETDVSAFEQSIRVSTLGSVLFSQAFLPLLLKSQSVGTQHPPTLIFTGATASVKSSAQTSSFSTGKWGLRALSQSLAKEFGPRGVHVAHVIVDGVIDIPKTRALLTEMGPEAKLSTEAIANDYWWLHTQPATNFTWEIDVRPAVERW